MDVIEFLKKSVFLVLVVLASGFIAILTGFQVVLPWLQEIFKGQVGVGSVVSVLILLAAILLIFILILVSIIALKKVIK